MTAIPVRTADVPSPSPSPSPSPEAAPDGGAQPGAREDLRTYAELGGFTLSAQTHPWYAAVDTIGSPEEARAASTVLAELRGRDLLAVRDAATRLAEGTAVGTTATVGATSGAVALLLRVRDTLTTLRPTAYEADLDALAAATANAKFSWIRRRSLPSQARGLALSKRIRRDALHTALVAAAAERTEWTALAPEGGYPALPSDAAFLEDAGRATEAAGAGLRELGRLLADPGLENLAFDDLAARLEGLAADEGTLYRLPTLRTLRDRLSEHGLTDLLAELTARRADAAEAEAAYGADGAEEAVAEAETVMALAEPAAAVETEPVPEAMADPMTDPAPEAAVAAEAAPMAEPEVAVAPKAAPVSEPEVAVAAEAAPVAESEPEAAAVPEAAPTAELAEPAPEPEAAVAPKAAPVAEPMAAAAGSEASALTEPKAAEPEPESTEPEAVETAAAKADRLRRPRKPSLTPGRPITAYSASELAGLVRWIDSDLVERTDDELLRAAMKELGFARIGPRIKEALGAAVAGVRGPQT
jgi:hypothetical protein